MSSLHARINHREGNWYFYDCGSAGGSFLVIPDNGLRIDLGDCVRIGKTEIHFFARPHDPTPPDE